MGMTKDVFDEYGNYKYPDYSNSQYTNYATTTGGKMGMTIAEPIQTLEYLRDSGVFPFNTKKGVLYTAESIDVAIDTMRKYQQLQADYENRLKADMVAMLKDLKEQLREMHEDYFETEHFDEAYGVSVSMHEIQQKINALRGEEIER